VVGGALYGRAFRGVNRDRNGLFQKFDSKSKEPSGIPFHKIKSLKGDGWERHWNKQARVPWLFNSKQRVWIAYDDPQSLTEKAKYIQSKKLGGMMLWSLSSDDKQHTLVNAVYNVLK
jgi:chitinase